MTKMKASLIISYLVNVQPDDKIQAIEDLIDLITDYGPDNSIVYSPWIIAYESMKYTYEDIVLVICTSGALSIGILFLLTLDLIKMALHALLLTGICIFTCSICSLSNLEINCILELVMFIVCSLANYSIVLIVYGRDK